MKPDLFKVGQEVIATCSYMHHLTEGKRYVVQEYTPELVTPTLTFPAYVTVLGDSGTQWQDFAHRFKEITC